MDGILDAKCNALIMWGNKCPNFGDLDSRPSKLHRVSSKPSTSPHTGSATCLICAGPHSMKNHPPTSTSFLDGRPFFSSFRDIGLVSDRLAQPIDSAVLPALKADHPFIIPPHSPLHYTDFLSTIHSRPHLSDSSTSDNLIYECVVHPYMPMCSNIYFKSTASLIHILSL